MPASRTALVATALTVSTPCCRIRQLNCCRHAIALVIASSTDLLVGGYYRNHRGSFYAADSGLSIVRQQAANLLAAQAPANFPVGTPPLPANAATVVQAQILAQRAGGRDEVVVQQVDVVSTLEDFMPQAEHWVNACAADYYQVEAIIAQP